MTDTQRPTAFNDTVLKHLEFIQNVVTRMVRNSFVDVWKLRDYCLNPAHREGGTRLVSSCPPSDLGPKMLPGCATLCQTPPRKTSTDAGTFWTSRCHGRIELPGFVVACEAGAL
jgi:hypothetical protein